MTNIFQQYAGYEPDAATQKRLNQPIAKKDGFQENEESFLKSVIEKLERGVLDPLNTRTLFNYPVYEKLSEAEQEATDLTAINVMSIIRQIQKLWEGNQRKTFQLQNLVSTVFQMKSKFEEKYGDVFII